MNGLVFQYFHEAGNFEEALILSEQPEKSWSDAVSLSPDLPRGWFELSRLAPDDRVSFTRDFWLKVLPYRPSFHKVLNDFFGSLDDVGAVLSLNGGWTSQLVYSLRDNSCFFRGMPPATAQDFAELQTEVNFVFPRDWMAFMNIHNGFGKLLELGVLALEDIGIAKRRVMEMILKAQRPIKARGVPVDAEALLPFFEAFGLNSFQCFFADWYPEGEMGNVYFSGIDYTISDTSYGQVWGENGAFSSFSEWLIFFLEGMDIAP